MVVLGGHGLAAVALLSFASPLWWVLDVVASLRVQLALLLFALCVLAIALRHPTLAIACGMAFVVSAVDVAATSRSAPSAGTVSQELTFIIANLASREDALEALGRLPAAADADLVLLTEAPGWSGLPDTLSGFHGSDRNLRGAPGLVVLSRLPLEASRMATIGRYGRSAVIATVASALGPLHVVVIHAPAPTSRATYHFNRRYLERVAGLLTELPAGPIVVAGSFSNVPSSISVSGFVRETGLRLSAPIATWPVELGVLGLPIDYLLASPDLCVVSLTPVELARTDHAALIAKLGACAEIDGNPSPPPRA